MNNITINSKPVNVLNEAFNWIENTFMCFKTSTNAKNLSIWGFNASKEDFKASQGLIRYGKKKAIRKIEIKNGSLCLKEKCHVHKYVDGKSIKIMDSYMNIKPDELYFVHDEGEDGEKTFTKAIEPWIYFGFSPSHFNKAVISFIENDEDVTIEKVKNLIKIRKIRGGLYINGKNDVDIVEFSGSKSGNNKIDSINMSMRLGDTKVRRSEKCTKKFDELMDKFVYSELVDYIKLIKSSI